MRLRGLSGARDEFHLAAIVQNLKTLALRLLYAGSNLAKAQSIYFAEIKHRPRIRLTIRQRTRVLQQWPPK
jgi:hypothetical protein